MSIKITIPNSSSDVLTFGSGNTPTAAQIAGIDSGSSNGQLALYTTASGTSTERVRVDASGNVGIGTSSPSYKLQVNGGSSNNNNDANTVVATGTNHVRLKINTPTTGGFRASLVLSSDEAVTATSNEVSISTTGSDEMQFATAGTERARIDSGGRLLVGGSIFGNGCTTTTANLPSNAGINSINNGSTVAFNFGIPTLTTNQKIGSFFNGNGEVGTITVNASATSYNTSSDYRLKNVTGPLTGSKDFIMALKPKQGTWKVDGSAFVGFLAHEFQEISPLSVSGEKDAVDADGKPIMQAMQASSSEVIANIVSLLQEQQAIITSLTDRITALENK
jgi:hypothetical protein